MAKGQLKRDIREASSDGQDLKLLLVDEDPNDRNYYTEVLRYLGFEVQPAGSYSSAVGMLGQELFDLVIVDQGTDFEGRSVLSRVVETDRHVPVLVLARVADPESCMAALDGGASEYVQKPLTAAELREVVGDYLKLPVARMPAVHESAYQHDLAGTGVHAQGESWQKAS